MLCSYSPEVRNQPEGTSHVISKLEFKNFGFAKLLVMHVCFFTEKVVATISLHIEE